MITIAAPVDVHLSLRQQGVEYGLVSHYQWKGECTDFRAHHLVRATYEAIDGVHQDAFVIAPTYLIWDSQYPQGLRRRLMLKAGHTARVEYTANHKRVIQCTAIGHCMMHALDDDGSLRVETEYSLLTGEQHLTENLLHLSIFPNERNL